MPLTDRIPRGCHPVDLPRPAGGEGGLRACLVVRERPDPVHGRLVPLGGGLDTVAMLGCLLDAAGRVFEWLRLEWHDVDRLAEAGDAAARGLGNAALEDRWRRDVEALRLAAPGESIALGFEDRPPPPLRLDPDGPSLVPLLLEPEGEPLTVCRDEAALAARGLPPFAASLHRYLWCEAAGEQSPMIPVTAAAPPGDRTLEDALGTRGPADTIINARGGLLSARRLRPMRLQTLTDRLGGAAADDQGVAVAGIDLRAPDNDDPGAFEAIDADRLFLGRHGRWGRLVETLHLKLHLLAGCVRQVRGVVVRTKRPLLNLSPAAFEVAVDDGGGWLPRLWTARPRLIDAGTAVDIPLGEGGGRVIAAPRGLGVGPYKPAIDASCETGEGVVLFREVTREGGLVTAELTLRTEGRMPPAAGTTVLLRPMLAGSRAVLAARPAPGGEGGHEAWRELRLRTEPARLGDAHAAALEAAAGVPLDGVPFELIPLIATPCDLHALAVLGAQTLLAGPDRPLPVVVDDLLSLARSAADQATGTPAERLEAAFIAGGAELASRLGPQRVVAERVEPADAFDLVPPELWFSTLSVLTRMIPGSSDLAYARDLAEAPRAAPHRMFDPVLRDLDGLLVRTRSLMVIDWRQNREVHAVIRRVREGLSAEG